jgi:hypothetical protein
VVNVTPRYAKLRDSAGSVFGWENIELISDRPLEVMLEDCRRLKKEFPDRILIASIMEVVDRWGWKEGAGGGSVGGGWVCGWAGKEVTRWGGGGQVGGE